MLYTGGASISTCCVLAFWVACGSVQHDHPAKHVSCSVLKQEVCSILGEGVRGYCFVTVFTLFFLMLIRLIFRRKKVSTKIKDYHII